jgi:hypothetical protein
MIYALWWCMALLYYSLESRIYGLSFGSTRLKLKRIDGRAPPGVEFAAN